MNFRVSLSPIGPWPLVALLALAVGAWTIWIYWQRIGQSGGNRWHWVALGLRMIAVLLCILASLRPSVILSEQRDQPSQITVLVDSSASMQFQDEIGNRSRWDEATGLLEQIRQGISQVEADVETALLRFDETVRPLEWPKPSSDDSQTPSPEGRTTRYGTGLDETVDRLAEGRRVAAVILVGDGASNAGPSPLSSAERYLTLGIPIVTLGVGTESAGGATRDIAVRELVVGPTVFVKNEVTAQATLQVRGYPEQDLDVELYEQGKNLPLARTTVRVQPGQETIRVRDLTFTPQTAGEKMLTLRVSQRPGELIETNNEYQTFLNVLSGGVNVLYLQGAKLSFEFKYLYNALAASPDIQAEFVQVREPAARNPASKFPDEAFLPGKYDVYVLGDIGSDYFTPTQLRRLEEAVNRGAGLAMLGGLESFGGGGWSSTPIADALPVQFAPVAPGQGQIEQPGGVRLEVNEANLLNYVLQIGETPTESRQLWAELPPMLAVNELGRLKPNAILMATIDGRREPVLVGQDYGQGRSLAFGGDTWIWARGEVEQRAAHRRFWRQALLWLAHREEDGEISVRLQLDDRRLAAGEPAGFSVEARDAKSQPIAGVQFAATVEPVESMARSRSDPEQAGNGPQADPDNAPRSIDLVVQDGRGRGEYLQTRQPGVYQVTVKATRNGEPLGEDSARFLVYPDNRELENPSANFGLLREIAETTGGAFLTPEELGDYLAGLGDAVPREYVARVEHRLWDNWPFLLSFAAILSAEWWLRKRTGWV